MRDNNYLLRLYLVSGNKQSNDNIKHMRSRAEVAHEDHTVLHKGLVIREFLTGWRVAGGWALKPIPEGYQEITVSSPGLHGLVPKYL